MLAVDWHILHIHAQPSSAPNQTAVNQMHFLAPQISCRCRPDGMSSSAGRGSRRTCRTCATMVSSRTGINQLTQAASQFASSLRQPAQRVHPLPTEVAPHAPSEVVQPCPCQPPHYPARARARARKHQSLARLIHASNTRNRAYPLESNRIKSNAIFRATHPSRQRPQLHRTQNSRTRP